MFSDFDKPTFDQKLRTGAITNNAKINQNKSSKPSDKFKYIIFESSKTLLEWMRILLRDGGMRM